MYYKGVDATWCYSQSYPDEIKSYDGVVFNLLILWNKIRYIKISTLSGSK